MNEDYDMTNEDHDGWSEEEKESPSQYYQNIDRDEQINN